MAIIAITGGSGFIGNHLAKELAAGGNVATVIARGKGHHLDPLRKERHITYKQADIADEEGLFAAFNGCDAVCHLAGINRETQPGDFQRVHVEGTRRVVAAAARAQVRKIVHVSFLRARPDCGSLYHESKWQSEEIVRHGGLDYTILQPGMIYGKGDQMIKNIVHGLALLPLLGLWPGVGIRERPCNPIFIDDFIRILEVALIENRLSGQTLAVAGPDEITLSKAAARVARVMGKPVLLLPFPICGHYLLAYALERLTNDPLLTAAQVQMLSEGMAQAMPQSDLLPSDLLPKTYFCEESIRRSFDFETYARHRQHMAKSNG